MLAEGELTALTAIEAAEKIAAGDISSEEYDRRLPRPHRGGRRRGACLRAPRSGRGAEPGARARRAPPQRSADRSAARHSGRGEGHLRYRRLQDRMRLALAQGPPADARCGRGVAVACRRGRHHRQDGHHRIRLFLPRPDAQSARSRAHARRFFVRFGGGGRGRHGAAGDRLADQRVDDPAGLLLRRLWRQADARTDFPRRRVDAVAHPRPCRHIRAFARRHGADS